MSVTSTCTALQHDSPRRRVEGEWGSGQKADLVLEQQLSWRVQRVSHAGVSLYMCGASVRAAPPPGVQLLEDLQGHHLTAHKGSHCRARIEFLQSHISVCHHRTASVWHNGDTPFNDCIRSELGPQFPIVEKYRGM